MTSLPDQCLTIKRGRKNQRETLGGWIHCSTRTKPTDYKFFAFQAKNAMTKQADFRVKTPNCVLTLPVLSGNQQAQRIII
uniref:MSP domain-containing protein n=1 Tax=Panagrellus redivivus TaxID=6233 RepID=A0A7E4VUI2_PANRE